MEGGKEKKENGQRRAMEMYQNVKRKNQRHAYGGADAAGVQATFVTP
jgi:hypothetical protein